MEKDFEQVIIFEPHKKAVKKLEEMPFLEREGHFESFEVKTLQWAVVK